MQEKALGIHSTGREGGFICDLYHLRREKGREKGERRGERRGEKRGERGRERRREGREKRRERYNVGRNTERYIGRRGIKKNRGSAERRGEIGS